jgi:exopolysaccharide biosynthesis polyprenyl glycosylphosphotransferase
MRLLYEEGTKLMHRQDLGLVPTLVIGEDEERERVRRAVRRASASACACVGELPTYDGGIDLRALRAKLDQTRARQVIVAGAERFAEARFIEFLRACRLRQVEVKVVPSAVTLMGGTSTLSQEAGVPLLKVGYPALDGPQRTFKRLLDIIGALGGLLLLSPLLLAVAAAIRLDSRGPVLFSQKRAGTDEKIFICYKFRSMYEDADRRQEELESLNEADGPIFKIREDLRITPVGHFLRRWSIDELPQLVNVLKGEMSLVGPRPLPVRDFQRMEEAHKRRLGAVPGMTGYWQISGRSNLSFEDMVRLDLYYIENWSLSFDIKIIFRTLAAVVRHEGAY